MHFAVSLAVSDVLVGCAVMPLAALVEVSTSPPTFLTSRAIVAVMRVVQGTRDAPFTI